MMKDSQPSHTTSRKESPPIIRPLLFFDPTHWTLRNNIFLFQDRLFKQVKGTAMGAAYAFQWCWPVPRPLGRTERLQPHESIHFYGRYVDGLFFGFSGSETFLKELHTYLNSTNPNLKSAAVSPSTSPKEDSKTGLWNINIQLGKQHTHTHCDINKLKVMVIDSIFKSIKGRRNPRTKRDLLDWKITSYKTCGS